MEISNFSLIPCVLGAGFLLMLGRHAIEFYLPDSHPLNRMLQGDASAVGGGDSWDRGADCGDGGGD